MINKALFSSESVEWSTPQDVFDKLNEEFHFTLDAAATPENAKCERYYTKAEDGLKMPWGGAYGAILLTGEPSVCGSKKRMKAPQRPGVSWSCFYRRERTQNGFIPIFCTGQKSGLYLAA